MANNILVNVLVYLNPSMEGMSFLAMPAQAKFTIYTENILLIILKVLMIITMAKAAMQKSSNPFCTLLFLR